MTSALDRLSRTVVEAAQTSAQFAPIPLAPAAVRLNEALRGHTWRGYMDEGTKSQVSRAVLQDEHPAKVLAELHTGLPRFFSPTGQIDTAGLGAYCAVLNRLTYQPLVKDGPWPLDHSDYALMLRAYRRCARFLRMDNLCHEPFQDAVFANALATGDADLREEVRLTLDAIVASEPNRYHNILNTLDKWRKAAGFERADLPFLREADEKGVEVEAQRQRLFAAASEPLGSVLRQFLDGDVRCHDKIKGQSAELDQLLDSGKAERGTALSFVLRQIVGSRGLIHLGHLAKPGGRWAHEFSKEQASGLVFEGLAFELAKRAHTMEDADSAHALLAKLLTTHTRYHKENSRLILKNLLPTIAAHPRGATVDALQELSKDMSFRGWKADIEKAIREARAAQGSGVEQEALPPLPMPSFKVGDPRDFEIFQRHFDEVFDPRLYQEPHDSTIRAIAEAGQVFLDAEAEDRHGADVARTVARVLDGHNIQHDIAGNCGLEHEYTARHYLRTAVAIHVRRETMRPFVRNNPDILNELTSLGDQIARRTVPTAKWLKETPKTLAKAPQEVWIGQLQSMAQADAPRAGCRGETHYRTLVYLASHLPADEVGPILSTYALKKCYITEPGVGIRSEKLGNACVWSLAQLPDGGGIPYLARILARTKYPKIRKKIDKQLNEAASAAGISRADLDEATVPTHDLDQNGERVVVFENGAATFVVEGSQARLEWTNAAGKPVKAPTAAIKEEKQLLKEVRADLKELQADLSIQPQRLQKLYLQDRTWPLADWNERYLQQPLMRGFTRRLVWRLEREGEDPVDVMCDASGEGFVDVTGEPVSAQDAHVRLWHPMHTSVEAIEAWRDRLEELQLSQPFAQVWREVYALTDAERATESYSNRWAAHILKQQQAMNLARLNGWTVTARMWVDAPNDEAWHLHIPHYNLVAEYWVEGAGGDDPETNDSGAYNYINTDRVTFYVAEEGAEDSAYGPRIGEPLLLADIEPVVFSEVMRSCDLFTAVASIAADPAWLDRGQDAQHPSQWGARANDYWHNANTAELVESGKRRHAMLERIVPRLAIADKLTLTDKSLMVRGVRHTYTIHLGSGACSRSGGRHICIVPKNVKMPGKVWLPIEGDRTLSIIISKAVLLAADDKIKDPVILAQI